MLRCVFVQAFFLSQNPVPRSMSNVLCVMDLGALYVNKASAIIEEANKLDLKETVKYDKLKGEADVFLKMAIPYLEKAHKFEPKDMSSMSALKEIYTRLQMVDQLKAINADIQAAK